MNIDGVSVKVRKLPNTLEVLNVLRRYLGNFKESNLSLIVNDRSTLDVRFGLVRQLHQELRLTLYKVFKNAKINISTKIVHVRDEDVFFSGGNQTIEKTRIRQGIEEISVPWGVPFTLVRSRTTGDGEQTFLANARIPTLVESDQLQGER